MKEVIRYIFITTFAVHSLVPGLFCGQYATKCEPDTISCILITYYVF